MRHFQFEQHGIVFCLTLIYLQCHTTGSHSLHRHCIATQGTLFPKNIQFLMLDDITVYYYNSSFGKDPPVPEWLNHSKGLNFWREISVNLKFNRHVMATAVRLTAEHFNHSDDHVYQAHGRCDLNADGSILSSMSHAYDGKDFVSFDVQTKSWTAAVSQAVFYKRKREVDPQDLNRLAHHYQHECIEWLKLLLQYTVKLREKKVPEVRILERTDPTTSAVEITCHVTGFYPRAVQVEWLGAGELPLQDGVKSGNVVPNEDRTYQLRKSLTVSEGVQGTQTYSCLVVHSSVPENITLPWAPRRKMPIWITPAALAGAVVMMCVALAVAKWRGALVSVSQTSALSHIMCWKRSASVAGQNSEAVRKQNQKSNDEGSPFLGSHPG